MARLIKAGHFEGPGERKAAEYFQKELPDSWVVICNRELVRPQSIREVDFILIGDHVVFAVEEKHWSGPIHGNEIAWVRGGESYPSPFRQASEAAKKLVGILKDSIPDLQRANTKIVLARVLLTYPDTQVLVQDRRVESELVTLANAADEALRADRAQQSSFDLAPYKQQIVERLAGLPARPDVPRNIGEYEIIEPLPAIGSYRSYSARHASGDTRILRVVEQPLTEPQESIEEHKAALLREYDALRAAAETGVVPRVDPYFSWDADQYWVLPIHIVDGKSLRADSLDGLPQEARIWPRFIASFEALAKLHAARVLHRAISPDRVYICPTGKIMFTDLLLARLYGERSIAGYVDDLDAEASLRAPECRTDIGLCSESSDTYALASTLFYWLTNQEFDETQKPSDQLRDARQELSVPMRASLGEFFEQSLRAKKKERPTAAEALGILRDLEPKTQLSVRPSAPTLVPDEIISGRYKVLRRLGDGATATTYLALDQESGHKFVLKKIRNAEYAARLARAEFLALVDLQHPNLVRVYQVHPPSAPFQLQLEYVEGSSLDKLWDDLRGNGTRLRKIGEEVLDALAYLEQNGIVHRDISPGNILVPDNNTRKIKLIDFGLATSDPEAMSAVGTPRYRAPEIDSQGGAWSAACDIYSLGVVLFRALTGRFPYEIKDDRPRKAILLSVSDPDLAQYEGELVHVLLRACASNPSDRYTSAVAIAY